MDLKLINKIYVISEHTWKYLIPGVCKTRDERKYHWRDGDADACRLADIANQRHGPNNHANWKREALTVTNFFNEGKC